MSPITLRFVETVRAPYPVATYGSGTATTVCLQNNDPYLAFVTQVPGGDQIRYLFLPDLTQGPGAPLPANRANCSGLAFDPVSQNLLMCFPYNTLPPNQSRDEIIAVDPITGVELGVLSAPVPLYNPASATSAFAAQGLATNGLLIARALEYVNVESRLELFTRQGASLGSASFPGRRIRGITASPWSWSFVDILANEIVIIGPFGNVIATAPGVGAQGDPMNPGDPGGMGSIAFDTVNRRMMRDEPQEWLPGGILGAPGTINHPDTPWNPKPWGGRHKLYIANESDQVVYGGYLTAE